MKEFKITKGSVTGRLHKKTGKNNQDALCIIENDDYVIAVVSDGCGSAENSEFGAKLLARIVCKKIEENLCLLNLIKEASVDVSEFFKIIKDSVRTDLLIQVKLLGPDLVSTVSEYLLATIVGFIVLEDMTYIFSFGDGEAYVNGVLVKTGDFEGNTPPYIAYTLFDRKSMPFRDTQLEFQLDFILETSELESILIASDGLVDLRECADRNYPGKEKKVGPISNLWEREDIFSNSDKLRRTLFQINQDISKARREKGLVTGVNKIPGLLADDTSLIVLKRYSRGGSYEGNA